jgi:ribonuclease Y
LDKLVNDGRINPARVEEALQKADQEIQQVIKQKGEKAADVLGLEFDPNIVEMLGRLNYRTSYGQNILDHSIECSKIAGIIADRLGVDVELAKRGAVLHDIGKAIDFVQEGSHDDLGAEICRKYGESAEVLNCIMAHHEDEEPDTVEAVIVKVADALSSARPGARKESVELYLKRLESLEKIAMEFDGVDKVYAIQAGREVRVLVRPEDVSDEGVYKLSQDIAERIEREMDYPGEVKVNLVRETRAVAIAH